MVYEFPMVARLQYSPCTAFFQLKPRVTFQKGFWEKVTHIHNTVFWKSSFPGIHHRRDIRYLYPLFSGICTSFSLCHVLIPLFRFILLCWVWRQKYTSNFIRLYSWHPFKHIQEKLFISNFSSTLWFWKQIFSTTSINSSHH